MYQLSSTTSPKIIGAWIILNPPKNSPIPSFFFGVSLKKMSGCRPDLHPEYPEKIPPCGPGTMPASRLEPLPAMNSLRPKCLIRLKKNATKILGRKKWKKNMLDQPEFSCWRPVRWRSEELSKWIFAHEDHHQGGWATARSYHDVVPVNSCCPKLWASTALRLYPPPVFFKTLRWFEGSGNSRQPHYTYSVSCKERQGSDT